MKLKTLFLLIGLSLLSGCGYYRTITGNVVDAETMKPIEGAVVMAEWTITKGFGLTHTESYKVMESVSDANGKVTIEGVFHPFVNPPDLVVYKPGYVTWSSRSTFPVFSVRDFRWENQVLKLDRFKPGYSYVDHGHFFDNVINLGLGNKNTITELFDRWESEKRKAERYQKKISGEH
jgi:hypothetical protein